MSSGHLKSAPPPVPAKLAHPRTHEPVIRSRLHRLLDDLGAHEVTWVSGPPGSGKSTLVASWLGSLSSKSLWYQCDDGDGDVATFFYYLRLAFKTVSPRTATPPLLSPEHHSDLQGFTRRWFRTFFQGLPPGCLCVFDNYQDVPETSMLHQVFSSAIREVPPGMRMVFVSRAAPPVALTAALARGQVASISWRDLRLTVDESRAIAARRGAAQGAIADRIHQQCDGWAAGLTLMLDHAGLRDDPPDIDSGQAQQRVFDYFATQILQSIPETTRRVLLYTAFLSRFSAAAAARVSNVDTAGQILEGFFRRQLFVEKRGQKARYFQYHPLFQLFLRDKVSQALDPIALNSLMRCSAEVMVHEFLWVEAFELFVLAEAWDEAVGLLTDCAPALLGQGRFQTVLSWTQALPKSTRDSNPWIEYWVGRARLGLDPRSARRSFELAFDAFCRTGNAPAQLHGAVGVLEALYYEFADFKAMDPWVAKTAALMEERADASFSSEEELRVVSTFMMAATFRVPEHPLLARCVERTRILVATSVDDNLRAGAISMLFSYAVMSLDPQAEAVARLEARHLVKSPEVSALRAAFCLAAEGYLHYTYGRNTEALICFDRCDALAEAHGLTEQTSISRLWRGLAQRRSGNLSDAQHTIGRILSEPVRPSGQRAAVFSLLRAVVAYDNREFVSALGHALDAQAIAERSGQFNGGTLLVIVTANIAIGAERFDLATASLRRMRARVTGPVTANYLGAIALNDSWLAHRQKDYPRRDRYLDEALQLAVEPLARVRMLWYPNALTELLPVALAQSIRPDVARLLALEACIPLAAPDVNRERWPIRVYVMGKMHVDLETGPMSVGRKAPRRTLMLLAAIAALGGTEVPEQRLTDIFWPDSEGDAAYRALTTALRRLRVLLGRNDAVRLTGGKVTLDRSVCWTDMDNLDHVLASDPNVSQLLDAYPGPLLDREDEPWLVGLRERVRARFVDAMMIACGALERTQRYEEALRAYSAALAADSAIESLYQGQMRCYLAMGRSADLVSAFQRLAAMLSSTTGASPSHESRALLAAGRGG